MRYAVSPAFVCFASNPALLAIEMQEFPCLFRKEPTMRKAIKILPLLAVLFGITIFPLLAHSAVMTQSQESPSVVAPSQAPQEGTELIATGQLIRINPDNRTVTIRQADNTEKQFVYDDNTMLRGTQDGVQGLSNGRPTMVAVHYTQDAQSGQNLVTIIEILPQATE